MFDVSFTELMVIGVVALVVIGPERLPGVARSVGQLLGRLQRYVSSVKADINREMQIEELRKLQQTVAEQVKVLESKVAHEMRDVETSVAKSIELPAAGTATDGAVAAVPSAPTSVPSADSAPAAESAAAVKPHITPHV
jgi:sec-independent protein translocase protein TatB